MAQSYLEKRQHAIAAAAEVFADKGYHGASTADIAKKIGIRQGSLYYYFNSKEEALEEVCLLAMANYIQGMEDAIASHQTFADKLLAMIRLHLGSYREGGEALKVHNEQRFYLPEVRRARIKKDGQRYREMLQRLFEEQFIEGALMAKIDCQFVAQSVIGLCNAWGSRIARDSKLDLDLLSKKCLRLILRGVGYEPLA